MYKIYSKDNCSYCTAAKQLLTQKGLPFVEFKVGQDLTKEMLLEIVPHAKTVPQIYYDEQYIGGYENLVERLKTNDPSRFLVG